MRKKIILVIMIVCFNGCIVGNVVSLPFKVTGTVINTVTPDIVGDSISTTGDIVDTVIPF